ncbi:ankyrin repeat-containing domain protein [Aspergillus tetrazonus]
MSLQAAAYSGDLEAVKLLLDRGADVNIQAGEHGTALQAAAYQGYQDIVKLLLDHDAEVNILGGYYGTALQAAAYMGHQDIVKLLLDHDAEVNILGGYYRTALQAAVYQGDVEVVRLLLDHDADVNIQAGEHETALQAAASIGHQDIVKLLLDGGADVNIQADTVKLLLDRGADAAVYQGDVEVVRLLLDHDADLLHSGDIHTDTVKLLLDRGADVNIQGGKYGNALQAAVIGQEYQTAKLLLDRGADVQYSLLLVPAAAGLVNAPDCNGQTLFRTRLRAWPTTKIQAIACDTDFLGRTPVHLAATNGDIGMLQTLLKFSPSLIDLNCQDIDGFAPLHCAVKNHTSEAVKWLIEHGAMVDAKDFTMTTPLQLASQPKNYGIFCLLLSKVTEIKMTASDLRESFSNIKRKQILLSRNEKDENIFQAMDYQEVVRHFDALSYQLGLSTSDVEERYAECITTLPVQQSILIFDRDSITDRNSVSENSSVGLYYFWWRKIKREERGWRKINYEWYWKVQSRSMPSPAAVRQPHQKECFLECHVVIPVYLPNKIRSSRNTSFEIPSSKHVITWIMVKKAEDKAEPQERQSLRPKIFLSTLEYAEIPRSEVELFNYCLQQLEQEWNSLYHAAEEHLAQMIQKIIKQLLSDAKTWAGFEATRSQQAMILQELCNTYNASTWPYLKDSWSDLDRDNFQNEIEGMYGRIKTQTTKLTQKSGELIDLEFSLTSIAEAQKSTSMNHSMKRLSWITTLFGMNVDLLDSNPAWWLYLFFALGTATVTISVWILFKRNPSVWYHGEEKENQAIPRIWEKAVMSVPNHAALGFRRQD